MQPAATILIAAARGGIGARLLLVAEHVHHHLDRPFSLERPRRDSEDVDDLDQEDEQQQHLRHPHGHH